MTESPDLLTGAEAIAAELGWNRRAVYNAVEKCHGWPIWVEGTTLYSSRSILKDHIAKRAQEAMNRRRAPTPPKAPAPPRGPTKGKKHGNRPPDNMAA